MEEDRETERELISLLKSETYISSAPQGNYTTCAKYEEAWEMHPRHFVAEAREECVNLIFRVCESYQVSGEAMCAAVVLMDRFYMFGSNLPRNLHPDTSEKHHLEIARLAFKPALVAVTCFLVSCKFRELVCPSLNDLEVLTVRRCSAEEIREAEFVLLAGIDWELHCVTGMDIAHKILSTLAPSSLGQLITSHVEFHVEIAYFCRDMLEFSSTEIAVAAIFAAAERLHISHVSMSFIPGWMRTARAEKARSVLQASFRSLVPSAQPATTMNVTTLPAQTNIHTSPGDARQKSSSSGSEVSPTSVDQSMTWRQAL